MNHYSTTSMTKTEQLRLRCEQQRQQLKQQFATIETRLHTTDQLLSTFRDAFKSPTLWLSGLVGLWAIKRVGVWSLISRGWMIWTTARSIFKRFRR